MITLTLYLHIQQPGFTIEIHSTNDDYKGIADETDFTDEKAEHWFYQ